MVSRNYEIGDSSSSSEGGDGLPVRQSLGPNTFLKARPLGLGFPPPTPVPASVPGGLAGGTIRGGRFQYLGDHRPLEVTDSLRGYHKRTTVVSFNNQNSGY